MKTHASMIRATSFAAILCLAAGAVVAKPQAAAPAPVFDGSVVSGLGARNIGSATMSGRISAIAARQEKDGKVTIYVGSASGGVWKSLDSGTTFTPVFDKQPVQSIGAVTLDPNDPDTVWVGTGESWTRNSVSVGNGVYRSRDGGESWEPRNRGTRNDYMPDKYPEVGLCVHSIALAAGSDTRMYQQNHCGMYRSEDSGRNWTSIEAGLPSSFGFPAAAHPRDPDTLFLLPLNGDQAGRFVPDGAAAVWRTQDAGATWQALRNGLPQHQAFFGVLRQAMAVDRLEPAGLYFGTSSGSLFASADEGGHFACIAEHLPTITSVETLVLET